MRRLTVALAAMFSLGGLGLFIYGDLAGNYTVRTLGVIGLIIGAPIVYVELRAAMRKRTR